MTRWMLVLAALLLAGCATTRPYYYDDGDYSRGDRYYDDRYDARYDDRYGDRYVGSRYAAGGYGGGDYWYGVDAHYPGYFATPYYYSLFWPLNRWAYDPYWYPGYHYGVTWFPRNYFGFGLSWSSGWSHWGHFAYSPYRWGWSDWYYDWRPWYRQYPHYAQYYVRPRHGDVHHEAERLAALSGSGPRRHPSLRAGYGAGSGAGYAARRDGQLRGDAPLSPRGAAVTRIHPRAAAGPRQRDVEPVTMPRLRDRGATTQSRPWRGQDDASALRGERLERTEARQPLPRGAVGLRADRDREWAGAVRPRDAAGVPWQGRGADRDAPAVVRELPRALPGERYAPREAFYGGREPIRGPARDEGWRSAPAGPPPGYAPAPQRYAPSASYQPPPRSEPPPTYERASPAPSYDSAPSRSFQPPSRGEGGPRRARRGDDP